MFPVNVSPDMAMYNLLKSQGYDTSYALAEYIDNSIHAWQLHGDSSAPLSVTLKFYSHGYKNPKKRNSIEIIDTGPGIARDHIEAAFKPAKKPSTKGLSEFGIGMKTASVWFADEWSLTTRPINDSNQYYFKFNLEELLESGADSVSVEEEPAKEKKGTTLFLHNLRRPITKEKYEEICSVICQLYQKFTHGKSKTLTITAELDDTPKELNYKGTQRPVLKAPVHKTIKAKLYAIGEKREWTEPVSFTFMGYDVKGFIQLLETGSYTSNPGLVLLRHNRVIMGTVEMPYIPEKLFGTANKYGRQRVYGELHLDGLPVSYTKDKFEIDEDEFINVIKNLPAIAELLRQSGDYRANGSPITIASEDDINKPKENKGKTENKGDATSNSDTKSDGKTDQSKGENGNDKKQAAPVSFISVLEGLNTSSMALQDVIKETVHQYKQDRPIAAALCFRIVLETGVLRKIEQDFTSEYSKVSDKGIKALLNYINSNSSTFFGTAEHVVKKCVQSLASGTQQDVIFLNNIAHGHYHPSTDELDKLIANLQPLLEWAYM